MIGSLKFLYVIQSLPDDDIQSGFNLYNDIIVRNIERLGEKSFIKTHKFFNVKSKEELFNVLNYLKYNSRFMRDGLAIHFETHGSKNKDGLILSNGNLVTWLELVNSLREINIGTVNNLYVTMATCFGRFLFEGVDPVLKSPYSGYISASREVWVEDIVENFSEIYSNAIEEGNLIASYLKSGAEKGKFFYKDSKTTFEQLMAVTRDRLYNDPSYREEIIDNPTIIDALNKGLVNEEYLDKMIEDVFFEIYDRQRKAFEFIND